MTDTPGLIHNWTPRHAALVGDWAALVATERERDAAAIAHWEPRVNELKARQLLLSHQGLWRGGHRTLLAALGVQHLELAMTAGLAWLLRADGHHGLGPAALDGLLQHLEIEHPDTDAGVRVVLEEQREETRADLVVYGQTWTVVVEAKTFAPEQDNQLWRLYERWQDSPGPVFVFLTRGLRTPSTAGEHGAHWRGMTWTQVADIVRAAARTSVHAAPGAHEYINTLEAYHHV